MADVRYCWHFFAVNKKGKRTWDIMHVWDCKTYQRAYEHLIIQLLDYSTGPALGWLQGINDGSIKLKARRYTVPVGVQGRHQPTEYVRSKKKRRAG